ncbi:MAG TPA: hypothetical protein VFZ40_21095, partial [Pyrinomonadaceae bacterium]
HAGLSVRTPLACQSMPDFRYARLWRARACRTFGTHASGVPEHAGLSGTHAAGVPEHAGGMRTNGGLIRASV